MQRASLQCADPKNADLVRTALKKCHREDLIGYDRKCLVKPSYKDRVEQAKRQTAKNSKNKNSRNNYGNSNRGKRK